MACKAQEILTATDPENALSELDDEPAAPAAPAPVPSGFVLVPVEPTDAMFRAADKADEAAYVGGADHGATASDIWCAMVDAAPAAPAPVPLSFTHIDGLAAVDFPSRQWNAAQRFARAIERAHGIGIAASKGER
jgi:hypothetical protein